MPNAHVSPFATQFPAPLIGGLLWEAAKYAFAWALNYFNYEQVLRFGRRRGRSFDLGLCLEPGVTFRGPTDRRLSPRTHGTPHSGARHKCSLRVLFLRIPDRTIARSAIRYADFGL